MKQKNKIIHYSILIFIYGVGILTLLTHTVSHQLVHGENTKVIPYQKCRSIGENNVITIQKNGFVPRMITVKKCDMVTFLNTNKVALYLPAFGDHPQDIDYKGFLHKVLGYNQQESFVAHTGGTFPFHDHLKDTIEGILIIK